MRVTREELAGPGQRVELSGSQCSSSSIDRLSWWEEAFPCSCSPMSSSSMRMISRLTNRCSRSTIPMSSPSSLKVSEQIETTSLCFRIIVMFIFGCPITWLCRVLFSSLSVLCTAPNKYTVVDATGAVKPQCCVDM